MRWKVHYFLKGENGVLTKENYGFKTKRCSPQLDDLIGSESDVFNKYRELVIVEFRYARNNFQRKLNNGLSQLNACSKVFALAKESRKIDEINANSYGNVLKEQKTSFLESGA